MVDDLRKLYDSVSNEYDVGDYESFRAKMKTSDDRKSFYDVIAKNGFDLGDYSMYEKRLSRSFEENNPQRQDGFWNTYLGDLIEKVGAGAADFGGSMYSILDKTYDTVLKPYVQLFTGKSNEDSWLKKQTDSSYEYANALRERADRYSGEDFIDLLNKGDYTEAVGDVFLQASESLPQSIMAMFMGGTGLALTGASAGSRKYDQLDSMPETKDMPVYSKAINAIVTGATEALTEKIGDVQIGKWLKGLYTKKGKDFVEKTIKNNLGDFIQKQFKSHGLLLAPVSEGAEEYIGQIVENITDYCTGLTNEWNPMEGTLESFVYGAGGGAQFASAGVPGILANKYKRFDYRKKYNKAKDVVRDAFPGEDISNFEEGIMSMSVEEQMNVLDAMDKDPSLSDRQKQAAFDFVQKANDYRSYNTPEIKESERKSREELIIETQLRQFDERITPVVSENGMIQSVNINGRENAVYITKGDVVPKVLNDGKTVVDVDKSSPELYYTDEEGKTQVIAPTNITSILSIDPVDGLRQQFEQNLREQIKLSKDIQAQRSMIENIQNGDEVMYQNEKGEIVEGVVEDASSNPEHVFIDGVAVPREMVRPIKNMEVNVESMTEQPVEALPDVPVETAPEYPVTKDGKIDYNTLLDQNPELFAEAWEKRSSPEKAKATLQRQSDNIVKKIESLNSKLDKETDLNKISDIEDEISILVDKKNRVDEIVKRYGIEEKPEQSKVPDGLNQAEYYDWVYRESDDINEILNAYSQLKEAKNPYNNLQEWQRQLIGKKIKADSYYRFGDRNNATPTIKTKWFSKDGLSLDILAKDLSQFGREVSEQDIIDFINENPTNTVNNNSEDIDKMGHRFSELASKSAGMKIGKPDSPTGKLFIDLLKAKSASVSSETLHAMENRLREYEQVQPPIASLEESVPAEMKNNDIPIEDLEAYEREMNEKNRNNVLDGNDKSVSLQNNNEQENEIPERVSQGEHGTEASKDGGQEESLYQLRARIEEASRDARESKSGRSEGRRAEEEINRFIESESKKNGVWVPIEDISNLGSPFVSGNENDVYLDRENGVLYKVNNLMNSGTLPELFKRIDLHNKFFPDTKYDLVGFTGFGDGRAVYPIYKQEFVDNAVFASPEEINDYMHSIGFERTVEAEYSNNEVTISDLRPRNVLKDSDGDIYVIDADFKAKEQQAENPINTEIERQELEVNTDPTEEQKEAGNYKMGHVKINGFDVTIEQPKGSVRSGTDQYGKEWSVTMHNTYGYIRGTKGKDGDHIDVFVGPNPESGNVFVIDQVNHDGSFDEHKVMVGFDSIDEAKAAYLSNYEDGWNGLGNITGVELEDFRKWVDTGTRKLKPFAEYKQVQESSHVIDSDISTSEYKPKDGKPIRFTKWKDGGLITKDDGQFCLIERVFTESGAFSFTSKKKIKSSNDVAYIFRQLETSSIENAFVVMVKKGKPVVIHAGMGTFNQTMVNNAAIKAAYDSIGPDYVAFVHNHPSGRLMASLQDQKALKTIKDMFPEGLVIDGIIINTLSGEYARFDFSGSETSKMDDVVNNEIPIKLYSFDKVVFDENYDPRNTKKIKSSDDVAAFVSSQRLGKRGKLSYIIIDQSGGIVGNLHTLYAGIEGNENAIANEISSNVIRFGGVSAIPYGDFVLDSSTLKELNRDISKASGGAVSLLDVVKIDGLHTESAIDNGVMESIENYQSGGGMDNDIRFRESVSENLEEVNNRFNEDLQQQIDGKLPKGYVYQLGRPSEALRSAGILDSEIEMSASRLLLKSSKDYKSDHPFDLSEVINLPNAIQKPIAVFESETDPRRTVVLTELKSKNDNFLVILDVIRDGRRNQVNSVISLYPKNSSVRVGKWFDSKNQNDIGRDLLKWVDKEKALKWLSGHSSNVNATGLSSKRIASIINNFENPTIEQGEISSEIDRMSDDLGVGVRRVRDKKDLPDNVQERMKNGRYPGMFDPKTGEVYIVMNEISDLADAQATMLHEIVGHKGIHGLFGERLPEFCDQVLSSMEEGEAKRFIDLANGNKQLAAEEYVSSFAEGYTDPMTWEKVKAIVKDFFRKMGIDLKLSDNDLKYILWKGKNRLKEGDSAMTTMNKVVRDDVVWRNIQGEKEVEKVREAAEEIDFDNEDKLKFHNLISGGLFKFREGYQDRMLSVKKMQDVIEEKTGVKLPDYMNVYIYENTLSSRNTHETEFFRNNYLRPMTRAISELEESGLSRREIENYVILKHGLERNEYMNQREETKGVDYAGIEMVENELNEKVEDFIKRVEGHGVDELWKAINDANHFSIKKWFDSGMINKATYEKIRGMYEHYVPLRGFDEETASDVYEYFTSAGSPFNSPLRTAEGRRSRADSPFAYIASMAESSITGGNKNLMKLHLYRLAQKYPSGFMSVSEPWYEKVKRDGKEVYEMRVPVYSDDIDVYRENVEKFNEEMKRLESEGLAVKGKGRLDVGMKISPFEADEHIVRVRLNGEDKVIYFHGDPRPAQAINGLNDESRKAGNTTRDKLYRSVGKLNRAMAANFTTRNPAFVVSNMTRDLIFAITALNIKEGGTYRNKFMLNIPKASGAICRYLNGNQDLSNPVDKMFKEFLENGGETGYTALYNIEKFKKMIDREVKKTTMNSAVKGGIRVIDFFSAANRWAEDLSRFSTFMTSREMGRSVLRSTADAKDVTVNFNRKGSGAMGAGFFRGLYLFFNAAVQSLDNFGRMGKAHKAKTFFTVMGYGAMGAVLPTLLRAMMGDDAEKEYCDLPDYVRKNNVCIYMGKGNGFLTIPLPIELRAFFGIGDAIYQCITGRNEGLSTAGDCLSGLIDLLPLNPVGGGGPLIPDAIKPIAQAYALNEDFTGKPIAKENAFNQLIPEYRKVYRGTSKWFVKSSEVLNSVTGGDFATRGLIDINPAKVEHLFESYFGGMEKTINQIFKTAFGDTEGKREARNVPIVNRFYNTGGDFAATAKVNERYFNVLDEVKEIDTRLREYNKAIASGENVDKALKGIKELVDDGSLERSKIVSFYAKEVKKIDNMIKSGNLSDDDMENLKEESMKVKRMLLEELQK